MGSDVILHVYLFSVFTFLFFFFLFQVLPLLPVMGPTVPVVQESFILFGIKPCFVFFA